MLVAAPFLVEGQDEGAEIVGAALARSIVSGLSQVRGLEAIVADGPREDVTHTLSGLFVRNGTTARLSAEVHETDSGDLVWESGEREVGRDLSAAAASLGEEIVKAMHLACPVLYPYISDFPPGDRVAASPLYARLSGSNDRGERAAISAKLVEAFPDDPAAHVLHAWSLMLAWDAAPDETMLAELRERLIALDRVDPTSPYDDLIRAYVYRSSGEPGQARVVYSWVLDGADLTHTARAWALRQRSLAGLQVGDAEAAARDAREAATLDPSKAENHIALSKALEALGQVDEAAEAARHALALASEWRHLQRLGLAYSRAGRHAEATRSLRAACESGASQEACANLAVTLHRAGNADEARAAAQHAETLADTPWGAYNLACYRSVSGDTAGALRSLRRAFELGYADKLVATDPDLDPVRGRAAFKEVAAAIEDRITTRRQQSSAIFPWQS